MYFMDILYWIWPQLSKFRPVSINKVLDFRETWNPWNMWQRKKKWNNSLWSLYKLELLHLTSQTRNTSGRQALSLCSSNFLLDLIIALITATSLIWKVINDRFGQQHQMQIHGFNSSKYMWILFFSLLFS